MLRVEEGQSLLLLGSQGTYLYTPIPFALYNNPSYTFQWIIMEPLILGLPQSDTLMVYVIGGQLTGERSVRCSPVIEYQVVAIEGRGGWKPVWLL